MMKKVDLHFHTINSDGAFSTVEILKMCEEKNLEIISITDHCSVQAYCDIKNDDLKFDGLIIAGIELSFSKDGTVYDVLGYGIDIDVINSWLNKKFEPQVMFKNQENILENMKNLYTKLGIKFDNGLKITKGKIGEAYNLIKQSALKFEENRIVAPELFQTMFFKKHHTNKKSRFYIDESKIYPSLKECLEIIHRAGGISSLAHSGAYGFSSQELYEYINYAIDCGVQGLELKYNCHTYEDESLIKGLALKHNLYLTGGSDFHGGKIKQNVKLGEISYNRCILDTDISKFLENVKYFK